MNKSFIQEAFKQVYLTEDVEELSLDAINPDNTESFLDMVNDTEDEELISDVYDLEAEAKEDLKQSYIGKVILDCNVCHSNVFFNKEDITEDEDGLCCTEIECPYCMSNEGYTIIGEVKPYQEEEDVDLEDVETGEVPEEEEVDIEIEAEEPEDEEELEENYLKSSDKLSPSKKLKESFKVIIKKSNKKIDEDIQIDFPKFIFTPEDIKKAALIALNDSGLSESEVSTIECVPESDGSFYRFIVDFANGDFDYVKGQYIKSVESLADEFCALFKEYIEDNLEEGLKADEVEELRGDEEINGADGPLNSDLEGSDEIRGPKYTELNEGCEDKEELQECGEPEIEEGLTGTVAGKVAGKAIGTAVGGPVGGAVGSFVGGKIGDKVQDTFSEGCEDKKELEEGIEDVSINTEDENITMTTKEDGGVVVETSPKEDEVEEFSGEEMIAPLEPETEVDIEDAVEANSEDEEEIPEEDEFDFEEEPGGEEDFEEFDEESFDNLGESYLKRCYENVTSFKTSNITLNENKEFVIEGKIGFDSGNKKDTQFIFKPKTSDNGKLKLEGYNKQISKGKKTFKLNCSINDKALICESLNYNYKGKNDLNESVRVYGTVKRK